MNYTRKPDEQKPPMSQLADSILRGSCCASLAVKGALGWRLMLCVIAGRPAFKSLP